MRLFVFCLLVPFCMVGQLPSPVATFALHPDYQLNGNAANVVGPRVPSLSSNHEDFTLEQPPLILRGGTPTQRVSNFLDGTQLPQGAFSTEVWILNHVNQPVGMCLSVKHQQNLNWVLGYYGKEIQFGLRDAHQQFRVIKSELTRGWKKYWLHVVATYDGQIMKLYYNGQLKAELNIGPIEQSDEKKGIELAGYFKNEPYMEISNLVKLVNLYDLPLSKAQINRRFEVLQKEVEDGILFPEIFHFTAGPYLHYATPTSINISWESSEKVAKSWIAYGEKLPLSKKLSIEPYLDPLPEEGHFIQTFTIDNLKPSTPYFYEIILENQNGTTINSGILTFATALNDNSPTTFAVIGDTEARPHVNFQVAKLLWDERPNFIINLGDLSDGGKKPHKFEWIHEYFTGITPLASRIPFFPVPGNGESDLYWYNRYHKLPGVESYYSFQYGNAQFFMLNSNEKEEFAPGGAQYQWLEKELALSTAQWKFVCHHHAPYSSDENDYGDSWKEKSNLGDLAVRKIVPLYEKYQVDIVLFGHLHTYQRTLPILDNLIDKKNGVIYLQGGGAGGNLEDFAPNHTWFSAKTYRGHHYFTFNILDEEMTMRMYDSNGSMKDFLILNK